MKIMAFDTTARTAAVALTENEKLIGLTIVDTPNTHSVTLLPAADTLLKSAGLRPEDINIYVCANGPGSFTGVRIGVATVKGLAFANKKPCVGVSALHSLAMNVFVGEGIVCSVMDARRGQLYNAIFEAGGYGVLNRVTEDRLISDTELYEELKNYKGKIFLTGDGRSIARKALAGLDCPELPDQLGQHNAFSAAVLGYRKYWSVTEKERLAFTPEALSPVYLRASQAERERCEKLMREQDDCLK